jgi:1-acyl-sn-glycerol-3-phosphate acyltransferase
MLEFKPPKINPFVMAVCKVFLPLELARAQIQVKIEGDGLRRFRSLRGKHVVVVSNHSNQYDPEVIFTLSKMAGEDFHFVAARECFNWVFGSVGWWFQSIGCYSVMRGAADHESFAMTRKILTEGKRKLVVFPEGEVTRRPDFLLPLRRGAMHLFFEAQEQLLENKPGESVYMQPVGIRWKYKNDITGWLSFIIGRIENKLDIENRGAGLVQRVQAAAAATLSTLEKEYFCESFADLPYEERVYKLRENILANMSAVLNVERPADGVHMLWLRRVINALHECIYADTDKMTPFQISLHHEQVRKLRRYNQDCKRLQYLIGVEPPHEPRPMTQERLADIVSQIERQVFGYVLPKGPRIAMVAIGQPIALLDFWSDFQQDKHEGVAIATDELQRALQSLIDELDESKKRMGFAASRPR